MVKTDSREKPLFNVVKIFKLLGSLQKPLAQNGGLNYLPKKTKSLLRDTVAPYRNDNFELLEHSTRFYQKCDH